MKVLMVASESIPFIKTGGLADVIGSLPNALQKEGIEVGVILPMYGNIPESFLQQMKQIKNLNINLKNGQTETCNLRKIVHNKIPYYFIDNQHYFYRRKLYGYDDDGERFVFFSRAVMDFLPFLDFQPDILHSHDWHTSILNVLIKDSMIYSTVKTVLTIHNLKYQGIFNKNLLENVLNLGENYFSIDKLEFYGKVNLLKGGIIFADKITTVSRSYAEEIMQPFFGEKLDGVLRENKYKLTAIVNAINYNGKECKTVEDKKKNKVYLQGALGLPMKNDIPILAFISRLVAQKGLDLLLPLLEKLLCKDIQLIVLGTGESYYEKVLTQYAQQYPEKFRLNLFFDEKLAKKIYAGADIFLMPSLFEPCGLGQLLALSEGTIPIVREIGGLRDTVIPFNMHTQKGNGFVFSNYDARDFYKIIEEALQIYQNKFLWQILFHNAIRCNFSWQESARKYKQLYTDLLSGR